MNKKKEQLKNYIFRFRGYLEGDTKKTQIFFKISERLFILHCRIVFLECTSGSEFYFDYMAKYNKKNFRHQ